MRLLLRLLGRLLALLLHFFAFLLRLLRCLLALLLRLLSFLPGDVVRLLQLLLRDVFVLACGFLCGLQEIGALLLALFVFGAEEVGDGLEEVRGDFQLGADDGEGKGGDAGAAAVVLGGLVVFVCVRNGC